MATIAAFILVPLRTSRLPISRLFSSSVGAQRQASILDGRAEHLADILDF